MGHAENLQDRSSKNPPLSELQYIVLLRTETLGPASEILNTYRNFLRTKLSGDVEKALFQAQASLAPEDVLNLQFTSGTRLLMDKFPQADDMYRNDRLTKGSDVNKYVCFPLSLQGCS